MQPKVGLSNLWYIYTRHLQGTGGQLTSPKWQGHRRHVITKKHYLTITHLKSHVKGLKKLTFNKTHIHLLRLLSFGLATLFFCPQCEIFRWLQWFGGCPWWSQEIQTFCLSCNPPPPPTHTQTSSKQAKGLPTICMQLTRTTLIIPTGACCYLELPSAITSYWGVQILLVEVQ